jgi:hypothetical protein
MVGRNTELDNIVAFNPMYSKNRPITVATGFKS